MEPFVGTGANPGFKAQERTKKTLTTEPFGNTYEVDEFSPKVEAVVVVGIKCLQPAGTLIYDYIFYKALSIDPSSIFNPSGTS